MAAPDASTLPQKPLRQPEHTEGSSEYGTLIIDGLGRIHGCGAATEALFGASHGRLIGRPISALIVGILYAGNSPGETARQLARLCIGHDWQKFAALDVHGHQFAIEARVSRRMIDGQAVFVFNLRRP